MTTFAEPTVAPPEPKRDGYGRYLITPADGGKAVSHTRVTTFIKAIQDSQSLIGWAQRMTALGLAQRPDLLTGIAAIADPDRGDGKRALDAFCNQAKIAGGGEMSQHWGTDMHGVIEAINRGADPATAAANAAIRPESAPDFRTAAAPDVAAYVEAMRSHKVGFYPTMVERVVVNSQWTVAGMFDLLAAVPGYDLPLIADLKTGSTYGAAEWAIQLAVYADATSLYDYATDTHEQMPAVDRDHGLIIHLPARTGTCELYVLDLAIGREMIATCDAVRKWRNRARKVLAPLAKIPAAAPEGQATYEQAPDPVPPSPVLAPIPSPVRPSGPLEDAAVDERVRHLHGRLTALQAANPDAVAEVLRRWPTDTCSLSQHLAGQGVLVPWQLDQIEKATSAVEAAVEAPFYAEIDPTTRGLDFDDPAVQGVIAAIKALPDDLRSQVQAAARDSGVPKFTERPTAKQLDVVCELVATAEMAWADRVRLASLSIAYIAEQADVPTPAILHAAGCAFTADDDRWPLTARDVEVLSDIGDAIGLGFVGASVDGVTLVVTDNALDLLVARYGAKRPLLTAARAAAKTLALDVPSKATDVVTSIPLVAHLALADIPVDDAAPND